MLQIFYNADIVWIKVVGIISIEVNKTNTFEGGVVNEKIC